MSSGLRFTRARSTNPVVIGFFFGTEASSSAKSLLAAHGIHSKVLCGSASTLFRQKRWT